MRLSGQGSRAIQSELLPEMSHPGPHTGPDLWVSGIVNVFNIRNKIGLEISLVDSQERGPCGVKTNLFSAVQFCSGCSRLPGLVRCRLELSGTNDTEKIDVSPVSIKFGNSSDDFHPDNSQASSQSGPRLTVFDHKLTSNGNLQRRESHQSGEPSVSESYEEENNREERTEDSRGTRDFNRL